MKTNSLGFPLKDYAEIDILHLETLKSFGFSCKRLNVN